MARRNQILDTSISDDLVKEDIPEPGSAGSQPHSALSHRFREEMEGTEGEDEDGDGEDEEVSGDDAIAAPHKLPEEYTPFQGDPLGVKSILEEYIGKDKKPWYRINYEDGKEIDIPLSRLVTLKNGRKALKLYTAGETVMNSEEDGSSGEQAKVATTQKRTRTRARNAAKEYGDMVDISNMRFPDEDDEVSEDDILAVKKRRLRAGGASKISSRQASGVNSRLPSRTIEEEEDDDDDDASQDESEPIASARATRGTARSKPQTLRSKSRATRSARPASKLIVPNSTFEAETDTDDTADDNGDGDEASDNSEITYELSSSKSAAKRRQAKAQPKPPAKKGRGRVRVNSSSGEEQTQPTRRSGRDRATKSMREQEPDEEIYADEVNSPAVTKVISIREVYQPIPKQDPFRSFHNSTCDSCKAWGDSTSKGNLVFCQGCSISIHKACLGYRAQREHMVTKVGHENFVLQCRRCIGLARKKYENAPRLDVCQECGKPGLSCQAFSEKRTAKQEEKLRADNAGDDPITAVEPDLINNADNVLFRCTSCRRGYHFQHLPALTENTKANNVNELREVRLKEYSAHSRWECKECCNAVDKVVGLVAWRPVDNVSYTAEQTADAFREDEREYLIKWEGKSYFECSWMPGAWVWGIAPAKMRQAFFKRNEGANLLPKWSSEEAIPEEYLRIEIVFDVEYSRSFKAKSEASDKSRIGMVDNVLVKFEGLTYDDAAWVEPPDRDHEGRWSDFVSAYNEYVTGKYFQSQSAKDMKESLVKFRSLNFDRKIEWKDGKQPSSLTGGKLMPYQMDGMNWMLFNFHQQKNVILADEMGLGKTIQVIAFFASLIKDNPKCWPFLVVTPNSTCPNWRREIKKWAPSLRVVAYYGPKSARDMAMNYELYPDGCTDLRAHVVITSYEGPTDESSRGFFKKVKWAGLVVDEGQRLKNDTNLLYGALMALNTPFQVLLTGTPLQNNKRELFNLLQFLDKTKHAAELDEEYKELTKENLPLLHDLIRPFFLRRTKVEVLKHLPGVSQMILPVTMSVVQKKLYKSILAKNPELIKSIFNNTRAVVRPAERGNLNNILMQLRKCLCHPFIYSSSIEERIEDNAEQEHRNLTDASSKFKLLEIMLPKLRERGHRVLLFSQFLNQLDLLEDFLTGLGLTYNRLDGNVSTMEKQRRIDEFNAPNSEVFAFMLSTRAGGVGINLATADTVIIMDPDFNPHQDMQALSRAHRIGQKSQVLVFQLMTKDSAEEKIVQIGRKKMALDQALIESMGAEDDAGIDLESILKHGAEALFNDDNRNDIHYDSASVDKLLDRSHLKSKEEEEAEDEKAGKDKQAAKSQFSFARVWANDKGDIEELGDPDAEPATAPNPSFWEQLLKQREQEAAAEALLNHQDLGRGKRGRKANNYAEHHDEAEEANDMSPNKPIDKRRKRSRSVDEDFAAAASESDKDAETDAEMDPVDTRELLEGQIGRRDASRYAPDRPHSHVLQQRPVDQARNTFNQQQPHIGKFQISGNTPVNGHSLGYTQSQYNPIPPVRNEIRRPEFTQQQPSQPPFQQQYQLPPSQAYNHLIPASGPAPVNSQHHSQPHTGNPSQYQPSAPTVRPGPQQLSGRKCRLCKGFHTKGHCPSVETCGLCGMAHFSIVPRVCPAHANITQIRIMLDSLNSSSEPPELVNKARALLRQILASKINTKKTVHL